MKRYQPALLGGLFIGVLSALPIVGGVNLCCCLWVVVGGGLTTFLLQQGTPYPIETADAALGGLIAGLVGAVLQVLSTLVFFSAAGSAVQAQIRSSLEENAQIPPEMRDMILNLVSGHNLALMQAAITLPMFAVFGLLGALLGVVIFRKKTPPMPPAPPMPPPPMPPV